MNRMRAVSLLAAAALALPGCVAVGSAIESLFKPPPPAPPASPPPAPPASAPIPPPAPPAPARARPAPLPPLERQLSEAEELRHREEASRQIVGAERAVQAVRLDGLKAEQQESFASVQNFLRQAREAFAARHYERAGTLARKAETLTKDLPQADR